MHHQRSADEVLAELGVGSGGLTGSEAAARLAKHGRNEIVEKAGRSVFQMLLDQFKDVMILVLIAAAVIAGIIGEASDTIAIVVIVILNAVLGFTQEYRAEKAMAALKKLAAAAATVLRDGAETSIPATELVPGDVVILEAGSIIPADVRLLEAAGLQVEEATLTGESVPAEKQTDAIHKDKLPLGDRTNMAYKGTFVTRGRASAVVTGTGMQTELGAIAAMLQNAEETKTPLQKRLAVFSKWLAIAVLAICAVMFLVGIMRGEEWLDMLLTAIALAVAAIPEALPAVITISLAMGARKMVKQNALIRKLPAVETLGSVTYICSDKTGTLTQNKMTVEQVWCEGKLAPAAELADGTDGPAAIDTPRELFLTALALSNDARPDATGEIVGDPTETALFAAAHDSGFDKAPLEARYPRIAEIPFDSERKLMTTFHKWDDGRVVSFTKGAMENILARSAGLAGGGDLDKDKLQQAADGVAQDGLRALGFAMRMWDAVPDDLSSENAECELSLLGMVGMMDPPREQAMAAVAECKAAGIKPVMITGDHPLTACAIATRVGILAEGHDGDVVMTGAELDELSDEEFLRRVESVRVYARVAPAQKLRIVKALQDRGQFVSMTGDGVNDAPALKQADMGVAMGITGTDVSKEAADMILLDDNFATIVKAVKEGRRIFDNIRKFIKYTMTSNAGEISTLFFAPFFGLPIPLFPIHILWINLVTDGLPGLALTAEPAEKGLMARPPRPPKESIFANGLGLQILWIGLLMGAVCILTQALAIAQGASEATWRTMVFTVLCLSQMGNVLAIRSNTESVFSQGLLSNKPLLGAFALTLVLQLATVYVPALNPIFKTAPLSSGQLAITLGMSSIVFIAVEADKFFRRRRMQ